MNRYFVRIGIFTATVVCFMASAIAAPAENPRFQVSWRKDVPFALGSAAISLFGNYRYSQMEIPPEDEVFPENKLFPWDRPIAGRYNKNAITASEWIVGLGVAPFVLGSVSAYRGDATWGEFGAFSLMLVEALAIQNGVNVAVRSLELWPRPYIYGTSTEALNAKEKAKGEAYGSFFSGHASAAFTIAVFTSEWFSEIYPASTCKNIVWASTLSMAGFVGVLRIAGGKHYPSDVIIGSLVGAGISYGVIQAHKKPLKIEDVGELGFWALPGSTGLVLNI